MLSQKLDSQIKQQVKKNFTAQTKFLSDLVKANSTNPHSPETSQKNDPIESQVAELIVTKLSNMKLAPKKVGASKKRSNVVCYWGPRRFRKSLILNGHMDTVPAPKSYRGEPYSGVIRGNRLYGLGAFDMKASLTAYIYALKALKDSKVELDGRLILQFVIDQESGAVSDWGTNYLISRGIKAKVAIIAEPGNQIGIGHRGGYRFKITTFGEAIHTGVTAWQKKLKGKNAITDMARVINALQNLEIPYKSARVFPNKKPVVTFPTKIEGGVAINMVPDQCVAYGDVRLMPGNSDRQVKIFIKEKLNSLKDIKYEIEDLLFAPSVEIDDKEEIVDALASQYQSVTKDKPTIEGIGPWNDAWMFIRNDIPTITQVPLKGHGAHAKNEWVDLPSLKKLTEVLAKTIVAYLGEKQD